MVGTVVTRTQSHSGWLFLLFPFACAAHLFAFLFISSPPSPDAAEYLALGRSLSASGELVLPTGERAKRMPLYPALVAAVHRAAGDERVERAVQAVQTVLAVASTILIALIARRLADARAGLVAGVISAIYGPFWYLQTLCLTETLIIFLLSAALLLYVEWITAGARGGVVLLVATGLLLAAAALTRANAAILVVPFVVDAFWRARSWRLRVVCAAALILPTLISVTAWGVRNQRQTGAFTLSTTGGLNFYLGHNPQYAADPGLGHADYGRFDRLRAETGRSEVEVDRMLTAEGASFAKSHPIETFVDTFRKLIVYHSSTIAVSAPSLLLICLGAVSLAGPVSLRNQLDRRRRLVATAAVLGFGLTALVWAAVVLQTYRLWANPTHLVPLGLVALVFLRTPLRVRGLFFGIYLVELAIGLIFIPIVRLRWTVDGLVIIVLAVGVSNVCRWLLDGRGDAARGASPAAG